MERMGILDELEDIEEEAEEALGLLSTEARHIYEAALLEARRRRTIKYIA